VKEYEWPSTDAAQYERHHPGDLDATGKNNEIRERLYREESELLLHRGIGLATSLEMLPDRGPVVNAGNIPILVRDVPPCSSACDPLRGVRLQYQRSGRGVVMMLKGQMRHSV